MADFPTLSVDLDMEEWSEEAAEDPTVKTPFEAGYKQTWSRFSRIVSKFTCRLLMLPDSEKQTLKLFERNTCKVGANSFNIKNFQEAYGSPIWVKSTAYTAGQVVTPTTRTGRSYRCTTAGTSASSEPTWPTTTNGTVTDGTVVWTENSMTVRLLGPIAYKIASIVGYWNITFEIEEV